MPAEFKASYGFAIAVVVISALLIALFVANVIFYNKIRANGGGGGLSATEARNLMALNAVWVALSGIIFIWGIIFLAIGTKGYEEGKKKAAAKIENISEVGLLGLTGNVTAPAINAGVSASQV